MKKGQDTHLIAIVDDDESVQSALRQLIEADGFSPKCFGSAEEFPESGLQRKVACLITDIRMPGMSGLELQAKIKAPTDAKLRSFLSLHMGTRRCGCRQ
jgi:FixJ family two-component response regulator